jgi:WD40 repeat protein
MKKTNLRWLKIMKRFYCRVICILVFILLVTTNKGFSLAVSREVQPEEVLALQQFLQKAEINLGIVVKEDFLEIVKDLDSFWEKMIEKGYIISFDNKGYIQSEYKGFGKDDFFGGGKKGWKGYSEEKLLQIDNVLRQAHFKGLYEDYQFNQIEKKELLTEQGTVAKLFKHKQKGWGYFFLNNEGNLIGFTRDTINSHYIDIIEEEEGKNPRLIPYSLGVRESLPESSGGEKKPWDYDPDLNLSKDWVDKGKYQLHEASKKDYAFVQALYDKDSVSGYEIDRVYVIKNEAQRYSFVGTIGNLNEREGSSIFQSNWQYYGVVKKREFLSWKNVWKILMKKDYFNKKFYINKEGDKIWEISAKYKGLTEEFKSDLSAYRDDEIKNINRVFQEAYQKNQPEYRTWVDRYLQSIVYTTSDAPYVKLLPMWHATDRQAVKGILDSGFAKVTSRLGEFFGKGIYGTTMASVAGEYGKLLLLNWTAFYSEYPVIEAPYGKGIVGEKDLLKGRSNYQNYDVHFVLHVLKNQASKDELVVFDSAQILPRYIIELKPTGQEGHVSPSFIDELLSAPAVTDTASAVLEQDVSFAVKKLKQQSEEAEEDIIVKQGLSLYIPAQAIDSPSKKYEEEDMYFLQEKVDEFLSDEEKQVLLLAGDSGAGKSLYTRYLEKKLWEEYKEGDLIPIVINLARIKDLKQNIVDQFFRDRGFPEEVIRRLKQEKRFLFVLDGYDEINEKINLITNNRFNEVGGWQGKILITSRSQHLSDKDDSLFYPAGITPLTCKQVFSKTYVTSFSKEQIKTYIYNFAVSEYNESDWDNNMYEQALEQHSELKTMISTPFSLNLILKILPELGLKKQLTLADVYHVFLEQWFEKEYQRLAQTGFDMAEIEKEDIFMVLEDYSADLAFEMFLENKQEIVKGAGRRKTEWDRFFTGFNSEEKERNKIGFKGCPLRRTGAKSYMFIHKSFQEYFVARKIINELFYGINPEDSLIPFKERFNTEYAINKKLLIEEPAIIYFIVDILKSKTQKAEDLKEYLFDIIYKSREHEKWTISAANAITILNTAGVSFAGMDLRKIRIRGADLTGAVLDYTDLRGADLRDVILKHAWMRKARIGEGAKAQGIKFGEMAYLKHDSAVSSVAYSLDGKYIVSGSDKIVQIWEAGTGREIKKLEGHSDWVGSVAISADSKYIVSGSYDNTVRIWEVESGREIKKLEGHSHNVVSVAISADGKYIASNSWDKTIRIWDRMEGIEINKFEVYNEIVASDIAFSADGDSVVSGIDDKTLRIWEVESGREVKKLEGNSQWVKCVAISADGKYVVSGSPDKIVRIWDIEAGIQIKQFEGHNGNITSVAFSLDGKYVVSGSVDKTVRVWDIEKGNQVKQLEGHSHIVTSVAISVDGNYIVSGSNDKTVRIWEVESGREIKKTEGHSDNVASVAISADGNYIVSGSYDKTVRIWDIKTGRELKKFEGHSDNVMNVAFIIDGKSVISGGMDYVSIIWEVDTGKAIKKFEGHPMGSFSIDFSANGKYVASGGVDRIIHIWEVETGMEQKQLKGHAGIVTSVSFSADGNYIVSGDSDGLIKIWDVEKGKELNNKFKGHSAWIHSAVFSADGNYIVSGSGDKTVFVWDVKTGKKIRQLEGHSGVISNVAFSEDGEYIVGGSEDCTIQIWEVETGRQIKEIKGYSGSVSSVVFSADRKYIVSGSVDHSVKVWDISAVFEGGDYKLVWSTNHSLFCEDLDITGIEGLGLASKELLEQRGAIDYAA